MTTTIIVRWRQTGYHSWPAAPERRCYLRQLHRHLFHWSVELEVDHEGREVEMHDLLEAAQELLKALDEDEQHARHISATDSCESMARKLGQELQTHYGLWRRLVVECFEDGECGARVEWDSKIELSKPATIEFAIAKERL